MAKSRWAGRVALVTGASSGIGAEIARILVTRAGMHVVGVARSLAPMEELRRTLPVEQQARFTSLQLDLADQAALRDFFMVRLPGHLIDTLGLPACVHVLVNNAGVGFDASLLSGSTDEWDTMLTVNVLALSVCTRGSSVLWLSICVRVGRMSGYACCRQPQGCVCLS
jgi:NAD(P)-dependent dehydrogenase (short-subunit alcohol dehydrogenase family)